MRRREFVKGSLTAMLALSFNPERLLGAGAAPQTLSQDWFEARRGAKFRIAGAGGRWTPVRLAEVVRPDLSVPGLEQFDVVLRGDGVTVEEGTHVVLPEDGDPIPLFLQPSGDGVLTASFSLFR